MLAYLQRPPDPKYVPDWKEKWQTRLDALRPWSSTWLRHQEFDDYWKQGSISVNYSSIECPVLLTVIILVFGTKKCKIRIEKSLNQA